MIPMFKNSTENECGCGMSDNMGVSKWWWSPKKKCICKEEKAKDAPWWW